MYHSKICLSMEVFIDGPEKKTFTRLHVDFLLTIACPFHFHFGKTGNLHKCIFELFIF